MNYSTSTVQRQVHPPLKTNDPAYLSLFWSKHLSPKAEGSLKRTSLATPSTPSFAVRRPRAYLLQHLAPYVQVPYVYPALHRCIVSITLVSSLHNPVWDFCRFPRVRLGDFREQQQLTN